MKKVIAVAACLAACASCERALDLSTVVSIDVVSTGWRSAAPVSGKHKLVPEARVRVTNVSDRALPSLQVNAVFRRVGETSEWGSAFVTAAGSAGLTPRGAATVALTSEHGYTGDDPQDVMLRNDQFVDATVDVFAKYRSQTWTHLATIPISRHLLP